MYDDYNDEEIVLSKAEMRMINRIRTGRVGLERVSLQSLGTWSQLPGPGRGTGAFVLRVRSEFLLFVLHGMVTAPLNPPACTPISRTLNTHLAPAPPGRPVPAPGGQSLSRGERLVHAGHGGHAPDRRP